jgi:hypothetical protein
MPYCPECGAEYRVGKTRCPDCEVDLVDSPLDDEFDMNAETEAVLLITTSDTMAAEILVEALKENDIPCLMRSGAGTYSGIISITPSMKGISIYVPESALEEAVEIAETIIPDFELPDEKD